MTWYTFRKSNTSKRSSARPCLESLRHSRIREPESLQDENTDTNGALGGIPSGLILVFRSRENLQKDLCERESTADEYDAIVESRFNLVSIDTPTLCLTLCQLEKWCISLLLSDRIQISFPVGRDAREPKGLINGY
ncbi:hypothetical protein TNCV_2734081 [Trichonephila clavipes]|nr:hypothetical protein TNCV_2734081 [Trichonephila clavipes]